MAEPAFSINFTAKMLAAEACEPGDALVYDSDEGVWRVATEDVRTALGKRAEAIALTRYGGSAVGKVSYQSTGILANEISGLGTGAAQWVRVSDAGRLERVASPAEGDDLVGKAAVDGRVAIDMGKWDSGNIAGGGATPGGSDGDLQRNATGALAPVRTAADGAPSTGAVTRWDGTKAVWDNDPVELPDDLAAGDLLYFDGTDLQRIPIGTEGQVLTIGLGLSIGWANPTGGGVDFDPATLPLTGWWRDFSASPWSGTASAGSSSSNALSEASNPPAAGTAVNSHTPADFDGANDRLVSTAVLSDFITSTACSGWVLFNADTATTDAGEGSRPNNPQFFSDGNQILNFGFSSAGIHIGVLTSASSMIEVAIACGTGGWHLAQWKVEGGLVKLRLDSGSWQTLTMGGNPIHPSQTLVCRMGTRGTGVTAFFDGKVLEQAVSNTALSDDDFEDVRSYINARYGLSL